MSKNEKHELVIIGAGPGGYRAAFMAADLGINVTLIDPEVNPGGVCLYRGCIPTKALLHISKTINDARKAENMGVKFQDPEINLDKVRKWKDDVVNQLTGGLGQLVKSRKIKYIRGYAKFLDTNTLEVNKNQNEGQKEKLSFEHAIIATGVKPLSLANMQTDPQYIMNSAKALDLEDIPSKMLVIGAGYIGLEMASIYKSLGSEISVVELTDNFMPGMDKDLVNEYKKSDKDLFKEVFLETKVNKAKKKQQKVEVEFTDPEGKNFTRKYDKVLVSVGQKADHEGLGMDNLNVKTDEKGFIKVDDQQRTSSSNIYAIGDVAGPPLLAHKASYEGRVAAEAIAGKKSANDAKAVPGVVYTDPEIATCGLSEKEAKEKNLDYKKVKFPWSASGRASAMGQKNGFTKILVDKKNERIIGAGIVGRQAGDLISELVVAMEMAATAEDVALSIHPHPTLSETVMEAAEVFYGHPTHIHAKRSK